jgi:hypothetical protein
LLLLVATTTLLRTSLASAIKAIVPPTLAILPLLTAEVVTVLVTGAVEVVVVLVTVTAAAVSVSSTAAGGSDRTGTEMIDDVVIDASTIVSLGVGSCDGSSSSSCCDSCCGFTILFDCIFGTNRLEAEAGTTCRIIDD